MGAFVGVNYPNSKTGRTAVTSVLLTAPGSGASSLDLYNYNMDTSDPVVKVRAPLGTTVQVFFNGLLFPDGVLVSPSVNSESYVIEYAD